ncbi:MAG: META domain-containing protein [Pseudomonadota bacterium]
MGTEWVIDRIAGRDVVESSSASLIFLQGGQLAGNASCNNLIGRYALDNMSVSLAPGGVTMMACPDAVMTQEQALLKALETVERYRVDQSGVLVLTTAGGDVIRAQAK